MRPLLFFLVGPGKVGISLAAAWIRAGHRCVGLEGGGPSSRRRAARLLGWAGSGKADSVGRKPFDLLLVATPDRHVTRTAQAWARRIPWTGRIALHTSGVLPASALQPLRRAGASVASLHPLVSLAEPVTEPGSFRGTYFGIEGDPRAVRCARRLVREMGSRPLNVPPESKALYHLSACLSSGYLLAVLEQAACQLACAGVDAGSARAALLPLAESTLRNAKRLGIGKALTGPVIRGDSMTIRCHLESLRNRPVQWKLLHRILVECALALARQEGRISRAQSVRIGRLLHGSG